MNFEPTRKLGVIRLNYVILRRAVKETFKSMERLGIFRHKSSARPEFANLTVRQKSFPWSEGEDRSRWVTDLASAGYFFSGRSLISCFHCLSSIHRYDFLSPPDSFAWTCHSFRNHKCNFLRLQKSAAEIAGWRQQFDDVITARIFCKVGNVATAFTEANPAHLKNSVSVCSVCASELIAAVCLPCGHLINCGICLLSLKVCSICDTNIKYISRCYPIT